MDENGNWKFAPAYDLTFSASSHGQHSTLVAGEGANPTEKNLLELAQIFGVKNGAEIIEEVKSVIKQWPEFAQLGGVSNSSTKLISRATKSYLH